MKWNDQWCGKNSFATCFLELFTISHAKEESVSNLSMFTYGVSIMSCYILISNLSLEKHMETEDPL